MFALGFTNYWDTYFAGRAAPLGRVPAELVDALFYNFAPGEVARHIPTVWQTTTPEAALAARQQGCVNALRRILGDEVDSAAFAHATELLCGHARVEREQDVSLESGDALDSEGGDVPVAPVLAQQRSGMEHAGHHLVGDRERP